MTQMVDFAFNQLSRIGQDEATHTQENIMNSNNV